MIECIFTWDYEIYGNGLGALRQLVYEPTERLRAIFERWDARFVAFVEVAELEQIEKYRADPAIEEVKGQIKDLYRAGFEIGLHLHPQWCNACYQGGEWLLDYDEYNLCVLPRARIVQLVEHSLDYLRRLLGESDFTPLAFRAGNWLFQPTQVAASVLAEQGLRIDSSVFKGGLQHHHGLDYRPAARNGYYWSFSDNVNEVDPAGPVIEVPIYTEMVPSWRMATCKRLGFKNPRPAAGRSLRQRANRVRDLLRLRYPLKFDFSRMTIDELTGMVDRVVRQDVQNPTLYRPLVAIGHSKDSIDPRTIDTFLSVLKDRDIKIATFESACPKLLRGTAPTAVQS